MTGVILDLDGTLVDSNYDHVVAWARAFAHVGVLVPACRIHPAIGISADQLVAHVAGERVENAVGDDIRAVHAQEYERLRTRSVRLLPGAERVMDELRRRGLRTAVATSGSKADTDVGLAEVPGSGLLDAVVTGDDVDRGKPAPDLLAETLERLGDDRALVIGDAPWDMIAAQAVGQPGIGVLTGGFDERTLREAGARDVRDSLAEVLDDLDPMLAG